MIREDIENVIFSELNELERQEYTAQLMLNIRRLTLQLMNSGDHDLAAILSIMTALALHDPSKLPDLRSYATKMYEISRVEIETLRRNQEAIDALNSKANKPDKSAEPVDDFPPLDSDKEQ